MARPIATVLILYPSVIFEFHSRSFKKKKHGVFIMLPLYAWGCSCVMLGRGYKRIFCTKEEILFSELADWLVVNALPLNMRKMPDSWCSSLHFGTLHLHQQYFPWSQRTTTLDPFHPFFIRKAKLNSKGKSHETDYRWGILVIFILYSNI